MEATAAERAAIAAEVGLPGIDRLEARFLLVPRAGERVAVTGTLVADVKERCVVSLDDFASRITQPIDLAFAPQDDRGPSASRGGRDAARVPARAVVPASVPGSDDQVDPPDAIIDGRIDLGAVAVEHLVLGRDPYPRKPGAQFEDASFGGAGVPDPSPFAVLERLKGES